MIVLWLPCRASFFNSMIRFGVLPGRFPYFQDIWTPLQLEPTDEDRDRRRFEAIARLSPGGSTQAHLVARAEDVAARHPDTNEGWSVQARYLRDEWIPPVKRVAAATQFVQVSFVLLIACANGANLMLARESARRYETVMKGALGTTGGLVRQSITEGIVLASLGGVLGIYMATWGDVWFKSLILVPTPYWVRFPFDWTAMGFSLLAVVVTGVGISMLPARGRLAATSVRAIQEWRRAAKVRPKQALFARLLRAVVPSRREGPHPAERVSDSTPAWAR